MDREFEEALGRESLSPQAEVRAPLLVFNHKNANPDLCEAFALFIVVVEDLVGVPLDQSIVGNNHEARR